jgi:hypothetical protein
MHPHRVSHGLHVRLIGPDLDDLSEEQPTSVPPGLAAAVASLGVTLVPVVTNVRALEDNDFRMDWMVHAHGAVLAGIAQAFSPSFARVNLASSYDAGHLTPWGSHPLVDQHYSTSTTRMAHDAEQFSRLDRLRALLDWPEGLKVLDVCFDWRSRKPGDVPNCGRCEKCLRTLSAMVALGLPTAELSAFRDREVSRRTMRRIIALQDPYERLAWQENLRALQSSGHISEARAARSLLRRDAVLRVIDRGPIRSALRALKPRLLHR